MEELKMSGLSLNESFFQKNDLVTLKFKDGSIQMFRILLYSMAYFSDIFQEFPDTKSLDLSNSNVTSYYFEMFFLGIIFRYKLFLKSVDKKEELQIMLEIFEKFVYIDDYFSGDWYYSIVSKLIVPIFDKHKVSFYDFQDNYIGFDCFEKTNKKLLVEFLKNFQIKETEKNNINESQKILNHEK